MDSKLIVGKSPRSNIKSINPHVGVSVTHVVWCKYYCTVDHQKTYSCKELHSAVGGFLPLIVTLYAQCWWSYGVVLYNQEVCECLKGLWGLVHRV